MYILGSRNKQAIAPGSKKGFFERDKGGMIRAEQCYIGLQRGQLRCIDVVLQELQAMTASVLGVLGAMWGYGVGGG